jgi:hypothetical protein
MHVCDGETIGERSSQRNTTTRERQYNTENAQGRDTNPTASPGEGSFAATAHGHRAILLPFRPIQHILFEFGGAHRGRRALIGLRYALPNVWHAHSLTLVCG